MASDKPLIIEVRMAWWLEPYIIVLCAFCAITGQEPDWDKFNRVVERATRLKQVDHITVEV